MPTLMTDGEREGEEEGEGKGEGERKTVFLTSCQSTHVYVRASPSFSGMQDTYDCGIHLDNM